MLIASAAIRSSTKLKYSPPQLNLNAYYGKHVCQRSIHIFFPAIFVTYCVIQIFQFLLHLVIFR